MLIGGGGEKKTLRLVAEHAHIWHGFGDPDTIAHKHEVLDAHCADIGRDPAEIERSAGVGDHAPSELGDKLYDAGTRLFTVHAGGTDYDTSRLHEWIAWRDQKNA